MLLSTAVADVDEDVVDAVVWCGDMDDIVEEIVDGDGIEAEDDVGCENMGAGGERGSN